MGLRKGECYGLTWNDIEGNIMHIRRSVSQKVKDDDGKDYVDSPKNHKNRDILIPQQLITVLNAHKERQQEAAPEQFSEDFKICGYGNKAIQDTSVDNRNQQYANEAGLPHIRIHDFRHSHATFLINSNCCLPRKIPKTDKQNTKNKPPKKNRSAAKLLTKWLC